jgi:hypothetical protein
VCAARFCGQWHYSSVAAKLLRRVTSYFSSDVYSIGVASCNGGPPIPPLSSLAGDFATFVAFSIFVCSTLNFSVCATISGGVVPCCVRFLAHFYTILKKRITPADSLQAATAADCRDLRRYLFCPLFFVMAADFSSFHFICTVSCTIQSKMFVANTISDSLALLLRRSEAAPESDELL